MMPFTQRGTGGAQRSS